MSVLSDIGLADRIAHEALVSGLGHDDQLQPASVDLRLGKEFLVADAHAVGLIVPGSTRPEDVMQRVVLAEGAWLHLHPGQFVLGTTVETVRCPGDLVGHVMGKSSLGRWGLMIHATAGFIDPGFTGQITLELSNVAPAPIALTAGMRICQVAFTHLDVHPRRLYGDPRLNSHYQGQTGAVGSRAGLNN